MTSVLDAEFEGLKPAGGRHIGRRLVAASSLMLFLELAMIRWLGSNVVHLSYFSNFVLLGSFLGIGLGFLISRGRRSAWALTLPLLAALVIFVLEFPVTVRGGGANLIYFTTLTLTGPPAWVTLPFVFAAVAVVMMGPAEVVGHCFAELAPLTAYRYDLIGSLLGIVAFSGLSFLGAPPLAWGVVVVLLGILLAPSRLTRIVNAGAGAILLGALLVESMAPGASWSPYYKVVTEKAEAGGTETLLITANGVPHQLMAPAEWKLTDGDPIYRTPYERLPANPMGKVLIIGAGSGSDVAIALSKGAQHIDAVDIDPRILEIGTAQNPDRAYQDPRVTRHVNDGRAFLQGTDDRYDLILFALPDSLTLVSGASQIRLESFLFTLEALESVRDHLTPQGAFAMYNFYREPWLIDRLANTAAEAFGHAPCLDTFDDAQAVVAVAVDPANQSCAKVWTPSAAAVAPATDDAPFLYFKGGGIPSMYLLTLLGIIVASLVAVRAVGGPFRAMGAHADLFFMGAAFLLLETKNVATFALLFGTTWFVNALVFAGVLTIVLAAVETTRRFTTPTMPVLFGAIIAALALAWIVTPEHLLGLPFWPRVVSATLLAFLPIFLANVAFSKRFKDSADSQSAFAVNLLGAIVGGCLEYSALLVGYNNLLIVTGVLYLVAFLLVRSRRVTPAAR